jgi:hypothetical protein
MNDSSMNMLMTNYKSDVMELMANMINYLNVSLYEGQFTLKNEQSRRRLNEIYDAQSCKSHSDPSIRDIIEFYMNVKELRNVTDTDDSDYTRYMRLLRCYIRLCDA